MKITTAILLLLRGDWQLLKLRWRLYIANQRLEQSKGGPFIYKELGFRMVCHPDWADSRYYFSKLDTDSLELALIRQWLSPGDLVFDFGANIGLHSLAAAEAVGESGRVVSIDADRYAITKLTDAAQLLDYPQITPVHTAIAQEPGSVTFYIKNDHHDTGGQSLLPDETSKSQCVAVQVPAQTTSGLVSHLAIKESPALVKIDVEGAEILVLSQAPKIWFELDALWIVEINPSALSQFGHSPQNVTDFFPRQNFECWILSKHPIAPNHEPTLEKLRENHDFSTSYYYNLFAIPRGPSEANRVKNIRRFFSAT